MAACGSDGSSSSDGEQQAYCRAKRAAWTEAEEERLVMLAGKLEPGQRLSWRFLAEELGTGRSPKQCREHYLNSLQPNMKKGKWTQVEEYLIAQGHSRLGSQWCKISSMVPGRTDNAVKNFYNATSRSKALSRPESILVCDGHAPHAYYAHGVMSNAH
ncbi:Homeodomain-like protein [Haematococcus lacustris]